jgi:hypothetical protein
MTSDGLQAHIAADSRGQWFVLTDEINMDSAQASGRWIKATNAVEIER